MEAAGSASLFVIDFEPVAQSQDDDFIASLAMQR
jgi:hypothetical protein